MLHNEALVENNLIDQVTRETIRLSEQGSEADEHSQERKDFIEDVCIKFFQEEKAALSIDQIQDRDARIRALEKLAGNIKMAISGSNGSDKDPYRNVGHLSDEDAHQQFAGLALKNLVGKYGTGDAALGHLSMIEAYKNLGGAREREWRNMSPEERSQAEDQTYISQTKNHLGTLNFMRAFRAGFGADSRIVRGVMGSASSIDWADRRAVSVRGYREAIGDIRDGHPIIPPDLPENQKQAIAEQFTKDVEAAKAIAEQRKVGA